MKTTKFALVGAAVIAVTTFSVPALAFTHHPATPAENAQTEDLNAQSLASAQANTVPNIGATTNTSATGGTNNGMMSGSNMNATGTDENGNAATQPTPPPAQPNGSNSTPPNNGQ